MALKVYTAQQGLEKGRAYCAYQERSHSEVRNKLYQWGLHKNEVELVLTYLIEEGMLNEERFARTFARGKFRLKQWGRIKIGLALKQKGVSNYAIQAGLSEIDEDEYLKTLKKIIRKKTTAWKTLAPLPLKYKVFQYCLGRGYEKGLITSALQMDDTD